MRLTDERDQWKTKAARGGRAPKGSADQRGTPQKIMTKRWGGLAELGEGRRQEKETPVEALKHNT